MARLGCADRGAGAGSGCPAALVAVGLLRPRTVAFRLPGPASLSGCLGLLSRRGSGAAGVAAIRAGAARRTRLAGSTVRAEAVAPRRWRGPLSLHHLGLAFRVRMGEPDALAGAALARGRLHTDGLAVLPGPASGRRSHRAPIWPWLARGPGCDTAGGGGPDRGDHPQLRSPELPGHPAADCGDRAACLHWRRRLDTARGAQIPSAHVGNADADLGLAL